MAKYVKNDVPSGYSTTQINDELAKIDAAIDDHLDRKGGAGNQMEADIDMNSNDLLNVKAIGVQAMSIAGQQVTATDFATTTLPVQTGNNGKVLGTDGSTASWEDINYTFPTQTGNAGSHLVTNGSSVSWARPFKEYSSFASVIADADLQNGDNITVLGVGDATIVNTNPSSYYQELTSGGLYVKPLPVNGFISALMYGVVLGSGNDNTTELQNFLDDTATRGFKGQLPVGDIYFASEVSIKNPSPNFNGYHLRGIAGQLNSPYSSLVFTGSTGVGFKVEAQSGASGLINKVFIEHVNFEANNVASTATLVRVNRAQNTDFYNVYFRGANASETLLGVSQLVTCSFTNCYFRDAAIGVESQDLSGEGFTEIFCNVVKFDNCFFDDLTTSVDATVACRSWLFHHCTWEPAEDGSASAVLLGGFNATFYHCWFGDVNNGGTWITSTAEQLRVLECELKGSAIAIHDQTSFLCVVENCLLDGTDEVVRVNSNFKTIVKGNRILLPADNAVGIRAVKGFGHLFESNDVVESGVRTGTIAYQLDSGSRGTLIDKNPGAVDTVLSEGTAGNWVKDLSSNRTTGQATVDVASIAAGGIATFTITVEGAETGDFVALAPPAGLEAGLTWCGSVTAAATVTVRLHNTTAGAIDPASATWGAKVIKSPY